MPDITLILATKNKGKVLELQKLFEGFDIEIKGLDDLPPVAPVVEDGKTFAENACKKALFTSRALGMPSIADDSGLVVRALDGAPGVYSARFAGEGATDIENNKKLLKEMEGKYNRDAFFETVICLAVPSGAFLTYSGRCEGEITLAPRGEKGFGYDPLFYFPPLEKTFAQMDKSEKNRISHRGNAVNSMLVEIDNVKKWIEMNMERPG